jgi:hypothetical protein
LKDAQKAAIKTLKIVAFLEQKEAKNGEKVNRHQSNYG